MVCVVCGKPSPRLLTCSFECEAATSATSTNLVTRQKYSTMYQTLKEALVEIEQRTLECRALKNTIFNFAIFVTDHHVPKKDTAPIAPEVTRLAVRNLLKQVKALGLEMKSE